MSILTNGLRASAPAPQQETPGESVFSQGLNTGLRSAGAGLSALGGTALESVGATDTAKSLYDTSAGLRAASAAGAPRINSIRQVDGLDSAAQYGVGLLGQSIPALGVGLGGALVSGGNPLAGATLATAPLMAGDVASRQQEDPTIAAAPAAQRLASAVGTGVSTAALSNAVPVAMGGKLLGRGLAEGAGASLARNVVEGVGGNAAAGALSEGLTQRSLTSLNAARDTSGDNDAILEAAAGGAVMGAPFAGAGYLGERVHARPRTDGVPLDGTKPAADAGAPAAGGKPEPVPGAPAAPADRLTANRRAVGDEFTKPEPGLVDRIKGAFKQNDEQAELSLADRIAKNQETVDADVLRNAAPDEQGTILDRADNDRVEKVKAWASKMYEDASLTPEARAAVDDFMQNPGDRTKQAAVAGFQQAKSMGEKAVKSAQDFFESLTRKDKGEDRTLSTVDSPKLHAAIADTVSPALAERWPALVQNDTAMKTVTGSLRRVMDMMQKDGTVDSDVTSQLRGWFGKDAPSVMAALHGAVLDKTDVAGTERYYRALSSMSDTINSARSMESHVRDALPENLRKTVGKDQLSEMVRSLREHLDGTGYEGKPKAQAEFEQRQVDESLRAHFGDKTDALLKAFDKDAEERHKAGKSADEAAGIVEQDPEQGVNARDAAELEAEAEPVQFHGAGKDKANPQPIKSPEAHRAEFDNAGQAERLIRELQAENPDRVVQFQHIRDMSPEERAKHPNAGPDDGFVTVEGTRDETRLTPDEFQKMRVDTSKTSHAQNNASRIDTGVHGAVIDARAIVKSMKGKLDYVDSDNISARHRTARAFMEGIAAVQDHLGKSFDIPDETVIAPGFTYGEAKTLSMRRPDPEWMKGKTDEQINTEISRRENLAELNDRELGRATIKAQDVVARREAQYQAKVQEMREAGSKLRSADLKQLREDMGVNAARDALRAADRETAKREAVVRKEKNLDNEGRTEAGTDEQIHRAADHSTEKDLQRRAGLDDNPLAYDNFATRNPDGTLPKAIRNAIDSKLNRMENMKTADGKRVNTIAQRVATKARVLLDNLDKMKVIDQALLASIVKDGKIASISETVNDLHDRYAARWKEEPAKDLSAGGFPTDLKTRAAAQKILAPSKLAQPSSEVMRVYETQRRRFEQAGKSVAAFERAFAQHINIPVERVQELSKLYKASEGTAAKKLNAFTERVLGEGDLSSVKDAIKKSDAPRDLQRVVDSLAEHYDNPRAREVLDVANERLARTIERDPDVTYSMQRVDPNVQNTSGKLADVQQHIETVLGDSVDVQFTKMLHAGEFLKAAGSKKLTKDTIRISVYSLDPMSVAHHESLHAFLKQLRSDGLVDEAHPLLKAADSLAVKNKLRELLANEPAALRQIEKSLEERAAYMYQFWAAGKLELPAKPAGVLGHLADFFKSVLGIWTNDQRATHIMEYFNSGEYAANMADRSAVGRALLEGTNESVERFKTMLEPLGRLANAVAATGNGRLRASLIPSLVELADKVYAPLQGEHSDPGYLPAARAKRTSVLNTLADKIGHNDPAVITDALNSLQKGVAGATPEERLVMREVKKTLREMHSYMTDAGVQLGDLGPDYFPRVWEPATILSKETEFRAMMQHYIDSGKFTGSVDRIIAILTRSDGSDLQVETVKPGMQYSKERVLGFISHLDAEPFLRKNLYDTLNSYVSQATRRAEWARRFKDDGSGLHDLLARAEEEGATKEDLQLASDYLQGVDGTLGDTINPKLRRAFGNMIVYQNVRVLPLAIFSSLIDPMGVLVRGGTVGEAFNTMKRGFAEIPKGFKKGAAHDDATKLAAQLGVIDNAVLMHTIGSTFSQGMTSNLGRRVNDAFFKYNLMEQFNVSMRVGASEAAIGFLGRHADGKASAHSARWLGELGLKPGDVVVKNGRPLLHAAEFEAHGYSADRAQDAADKMILAVNKWVDGAILRPNAAHKPIWMNDPHFALISHLKQFVYSFQETILKRVVNEARHGNVGPAYALAAYVPFMLAADLAKGVIVGGGSQPSSRDSWDAADYAFYEVQRAGLFGVGQFGVDALKDVHRGGLGVGALSGPSIEQLGEAVKTVAGPEQFKTFAMNAMPANALFDAAESASTNAID